MSVRVNLLPEATKQRDRASQQRSIAALAGVVLLAGLGGVYLWASSQVKQAEDELIAQQAVSAELRGEQAELVAFQELADRRDQSDALLIAAMADEVSAAGLLQDIAAVLPSDTQLETLVVTMTPPDDVVLGAPVGILSLTGKTLTSHAPGVERVLISLDKVVSFRQLYLNSSTLDENDERVATFSLDGQIGQEAATRRYATGLPEDLR
jgi:Tfp pilus assembly protein PilN